MDPSIEGESLGPASQLTGGYGTQEHKKNNLLVNKSKRDIDLFEIYFIKYCK